MPAHGSYRVTSQAEGKAAERDESYKSCVITMLIFFLLCLVIILASWPWKGWHADHNKVEKDTKIQDEEFFATTDGPVLKNGYFERYSNDASTKNHKISQTRTTERYEDIESSPEVTKTFSTPGAKSEVVSDFTNVVRTDGSTVKKDLSSSTEAISRNRPHTFSTPETTSGAYKGFKELLRADKSTVKEDPSFSTEATSLSKLQTFSSPEATIAIYTHFKDAQRNDRSTVKEDQSSSTEAITPSGLKTFSPLKSTTENDKSFAGVVKTHRSTVKEDISSSTEAIRPINGQPTAGTTDGSLLLENHSTSTVGATEDTTKKIETTTLQELLVGKYFRNETTKSDSEDSGENWADVLQSQRLGDQERSLSSKSASPVPGTSPNKWISTTASLNFDRTPADSSGIVAKEEITTHSSITDKTNASSSYSDIRICNSGSCKRIASKMLSYMNHSVDPCEDFYEYACGGLEADPQMNERDLDRRAYDTIARKYLDCSQCGCSGAVQITNKRLHFPIVQARTRRNQTEFTQFEIYYESCLKYESDFEKPHRIQLAKEALSRVGKFYTSATWPGDFQDFTTLFANMLLHNGPLLFDIVPDINETHPEAFTLRIGPAIDKSQFQLASVHDPCDEESEQARHDPVDLGQLYENYKSCKNSPRSLVDSITRALEELAVFEYLENPYNISQSVDGTTLNIDFEIIKGILVHFPPEHEIVEAYRSKNYAVTTLGQLQTDCKLLDWRQLIFSLTGLTLEPNAQLQIYYKRELTNAMQRLEKFRQNNGFELNNALLGLYARNLYQDLVVPRSSSDLVKHCLDVATHFLKREASELYMSSFPENDLKNIKAMTENLFHELKETLKTEIQRSEWAVQWGREVLLKKLDDMKMSMPDPSYLKNVDSDRLNMTDNYFENSLTLMKKYRSMIYSVMHKNPSDPEQIWTFFAWPFQSTTRTVYGLNLIVVPLGAIDLPLSLHNGESFDYLVQATIGNLIAREIAHNFDTNGIRYWNGSRDSEFALMTDSDPTKSTFEEYIDCQRNSLYQQPMEMSLPATGQRVSFTIPPLTLNERLSDAVGMRLAHDTLARFGSIASEERLLWLDLDVSQLFYLAYAQTHCTKAPLTSSYVSLYEDQTLPSRIRIFVAASNNKELGGAWDCPEGSQIRPTFSCGVFPHLEYHDSPPDAA